MSHAMRLWLFLAPLSKDIGLIWLKENNKDQAIEDPSTVFIPWGQPGKVNPPPKLIKIFNMRKRNSRNGQKVQSRENISHRSQQCVGTKGQVKNLISADWMTFVKRLVAFFYQRRIEATNLKSPWSCMIFLPYFLLYYIHIIWSLWSSSKGVSSVVVLSDFCGYHSKNKYYLCPELLKDVQFWSIYGWTLVGNAYHICDLFTQLRFRGLFSARNKTLKNFQSYPRHIQLPITLF